MDQPSLDSRVHVINVDQEWCKPKFLRKGFSESSRESPNNKKKIKQYTNQTE